MGGGFRLWFETADMTMKTGWTQRRDFHAVRSVRGKAGHSSILL
tara:strand:- start:982 stop:1113 length:132 start_codon:yes stop_codon:yes gene_type:complete